MGGFSVACSAMMHASDMVSVVTTPAMSPLPINGELLVKLVLRYPEDVVKKSLFRLREICDLNTPSFPKLLDRITQAAGHDIDVRALSLSYQFTTNDIIEVRNTDELVVAIQVQTEAASSVTDPQVMAPGGVIQLQGTVQKPRSSPAEEEALLVMVQQQIEQVIADRTDTLQATVTDSLNSLRDELSEERQRLLHCLPAAEEAQDAMVGQLASLKDEMRDSLDRMSDGFTSQLLRIKDDDEERAVAVVSKSKAAVVSGGTFPEELLKEIDSILLPEIRFDKCRMSAGLVVEDSLRRVADSGSDESWRNVFGTMGFHTGKVYWSIRIVSKGNSGPNFFTIGVSDGNLNLEQDTCPGLCNTPGCSLDLCGRIIYEGQLLNVSNASLVQNAATIGVLLDMDMKTVAFFADGQRVHHGAELKLMSSSYFPVVSIWHGNQVVEVEDLRVVQQ